MFFYSKLKPTKFEGVKSRIQPYLIEHEKKSYAKEIMQPTRIGAEDHKLYKSKGFN